MNEERVSRSPLLRFLDSFLQERNIQWIFGIGSLLLVGSSLMLVTTNWESYSNEWKHLIFVGYTTLFWIGGEVLYSRQGLKRSGTAFMAIAVVLYPMTFMSLHEVETLQVYLLPVQILLTAMAATRIFGRFLRSTQPTFIACYLLLAIFGHFANSLIIEYAEQAKNNVDLTWMIYSGVAVAWAVFCIGTIKVNRHVFWLTEENRHPRIFGFFPIALLGAQFIGISAIHFGSKLAPGWIGFFVVLVAVPVLLTANTVARVFQQRTGDLVRPIPWNIVMPLGIGIILAVSGLLLSSIELQALVPAAALFAVIMGVVARRTGHRAFVWAMLAGATVAYNFSWVYYQDLAMSLRDGEATGSQESRLPHAFYGLTYLPLLTIAIGLSRRLTGLGESVFAVPLRRYAIGLSGILLVVSLSHVKALFPVGLAMTSIFFSSARIFRDRLLLFPGAGAVLIAAAGCAPFLDAVFGLEFLGGSIILSMGLACGALLVASQYVDAKLPPALLPKTMDDLKPLIRNPLRGVSIGATIIAGAIWVLQTQMHTGGWLPWIEFAALSTLLVIQSVLLADRRLGWTTLVFAFAGGALWSHQSGIAPDVFLLCMVGAFGFLWSLFRWIERQGEGRFQKAFTHPSRHLSFWALTVLTVVVALPTFVAHASGTPITGPWWVAVAMLGTWTLDAAWRFRSRNLAAIAGVMVPATAGSVFLFFNRFQSAESLPIVWASVAVAALAAFKLLASKLGEADVPRSSSEDRNPLETARRLTGALVWTYTLLLAALFLPALFIFDWPLQAAGIIALVGLAGFGGWGRRATLVLVNAEILVSVLQVYCPDAQNILDLGPHFIQAAATLALTCASSVLFWQYASRDQDAEKRLMTDVIQVALGSLAVVSIIATLLLPTLTWSSPNLWCVLASLSILAISEFWRACTTGRVAHVWSGQLCVAAVVGYLAFLGLITFGHGRSQFLILGTGLIAWTLSRLFEGRPGTAILSAPLRQTAYVLPAISAAIGFARHLIGNVPSLGLNGLALFLVAGFYFWRGIEERRKTLIVAAGGIFNASLFCLWRELDRTDPLYYCVPIGLTIIGLVELLKNEIPQRLHNPLRYLGSLVILVSPVFHIVGGSWLHIFGLMVASLGVVLLAIGLRLRALMIAGTAFLVGDVVAMVLRATIDNPGALWVAGVALGAAVLTLGAACEHHRETLSQRLRALSATFAHWN